MKETLHFVKASTRYKREHKSDYGKERIEILYEDKDIVVINKASGLLSVPYPGSKSRTAIELLEKIMRKKGTFSESHRPFVVHRLDRDTSGVMMFALNERVQKKIMSSWKTMVTDRLYRAVAENPRRNHPELPDSGLIDEPLAKNACHQGYVPKKLDDKAETCEARTNFRVVLRGRTHTLFELSLDTGKKNQIRAHLASKHYPLAGDENYRARTDPFHRLALHARTLAFVHPVTGEKMSFEIPEPEEWEQYVKKGDLHPQIPIWANERKERIQYNAQIENITTPDHSLRRQARKMDFIARGKSGIK
ncbi:RluA family pseudouridine synthase [uncultured Treponema sp.]|uniref:RluA family pseudouridine synthase n=1 Tax=uncultured Treponema sp. TaxID=162155 RepID=UPI0025D25C7E|nr:RluA family pseudouridine synthase [uncultured Treponema sp.]